MSMLRGALLWTLLFPVVAAALLALGAPLPIACLVALLIGGLCGIASI